MATLNRANITWNAKQIAKMANNGTLRFDNIIQRSYVWEQTRKSELIHSMIEGYPVPAFYARRVDGKVYDFLDGKQRINAIRGFIGGEYALMGIANVEVVNDDGSTEEMDLNGMKFDDLPEQVQDAIKDYYFTIYYYENITPEQIRTMFKKLNNGKPLSTKERNIANCTDIVTVTDIGSHPLFSDILTQKGIDGRKQLPMVMKVYMMLNDFIENVSFESKPFNEVMQDTKMTEAQKEEIIAVLNRYHMIYNHVAEVEDKKMAKFIQKKMATEVHMISLMPFIKKSINESVNPDLLVGFMKEIFCKNISADGKIDGSYYVVSPEYDTACKSGSAKNASIIRRNDELQKAWDRYFAEDNQGEQEDTNADGFMNIPDSFEDEQF